jgi:hypothetical protein
MDGARRFRLSARGSIEFRAICGWLAPSILAIACLLPSIALGSPAPVQSIVPPFIGGFSSMVQTTSTSGCGHATLSPTMTWSWLNGSVVGGDRTAATNCNPSLAGGSGGGYAFTSVTLSIQVPLTVPVSGPHLVQANWTVRPWSNISYHPGLCVAGASSVSVWYCEEDAYWSLFGDVYLYDTTAGTATGSNNLNIFLGTSNLTEHENGVTIVQKYSDLSVSQLGNKTFFINSTLNSNHVYDLVFKLLLESYTQFTSYNTTLKGGFGHCYLKMSGAGGATRLNDIEIL